MIEAGQVPEVTVLTEGEFGVGRACDEARAHEDRNGIGSHRIEHSLTAFGEHAASLSHRAALAAPAALNLAFRAARNPLSRFR